MNFLGIDIGGLDLPWFLALSRVAFAAMAFAGAFLAARTSDSRRIGRIVLVVGMAGHALAWFATTFPLANLYGVNGSMDRENHLGWTNVVALGFSPLYTFQINHLHFEPLWPLLAAVLAGFDVARVPVVFQWAPLVAGLLLLLSVRFAWRRGVTLAGSEEADAVSAFAALGAVLLMAAPGDFAGLFRNPWALTFLLKPNHVLGLVLVPLAALAVARAHSWRTRIFAGFVLQLVGWAFVIHMALFVAGLLLFVAFSFITRRSERMKDLLDAGTAIGVNLLIVSPYLVMLVVAYPFLHASDAYRVSLFTERPIEAPFRLGVLVLLSAFGVFRTHAEGSRLGRIFSFQWLTAHTIWQLYPILGLFGLAREPDEVFYWGRFWTGLFAGVGAFRAAQLVLTRFRRVNSGFENARPGVAAALALTFLTPALLPSWWDPVAMDGYFVAARRPMPDWIAEPTSFIRGNTPPDAVFAGDRNYARWIAAYGARRVLLSRSLNLPNDHPRRSEVEKALLMGGPESLLVEARDRYEVQYVLATSSPMPQVPDVTLDQLRTRPRLETVYDKQFSDTRVMIFKVRPQSGS